VDALRASTVERVTIVARRGPVQAAFATKELRELCSLQGVRATVPARDLVLDDTDQAALEDKSNRAKKRQYGILAKLEEPSAPGGGGGKEVKRDEMFFFQISRPRQLALPVVSQVIFRFCLSPIEAIPCPDGVAVAGLRCERTCMEGAIALRKAVATGETEDLPSGIAPTATTATATTTR